MRNWSVKKRIAAAFGVTIAVFLIAGVLAFLDLLRVRRHANLLLIDTLPGLSVNGEVNDLIQSHEAAMQHRRNARSAAEQSQLDAELAAYEKKIRERFQAYPATITRDSDRTLFARLTDSYGLYERAARTAMATPTEGAYLNLARTHTRVSIDARALLSDNGKAGLAAAASVDAVARSTQIAVITAMLIAILVALLAGLWLYRSITRPLSSMVAVADRMRQGNFSSRITVDRDDELGVLAGAMNRVGEELGTLINGVQSSGIQVSTSATEIAATAREQQATANEIAATTAEIGATSREISATSKELSKTMTDIVRVSESAASVAVSGQAGILRMQETMQQIIDASAAVATKLADVNERAGNISLVVTTITKVADQTNLLSLNAAIEAEKAGEYGRGFSVVASEIRRLADQTAIATQDIEKTVTKMQSAVASGVMGMEKFGDQVRTGVSVVRQVGADLQSIIEQVQMLAPAFESVNEGMQGQSVAAEQISEALAQLSESAQQTVESLSQSNSAIEQLNDVTRGLRQGVSRFTFES